MNTESCGATVVRLWNPRNWPCHKFRLENLKRWDSCCWLVLISWCRSNWRRCLHPTKDVWDKPDKHCRNRQKMGFRYAPEIWCATTKTGIEETSKLVPLWGFMTNFRGVDLSKSQASLSALPSLTKAWPDTPDTRCEDLGPLESAAKSWMIHGHIRTSTSWM
jgi:hypothetical protein